MERYFHAIRGLEDVAVAPGSVDVTVTSDIRTVTAKESMDGGVPVDDGEFIVTMGRTVELTVSDPQLQRSLYLGRGQRASCVADNTTYTFVAGQE